MLCFSGMETRLSGSLLETIALIYGGSSRIFLLPQHRVPVVLIGFHGSQKTPRDETQHIRVWIQRGRELISQTEWEFNQRRSGGGVTRSVVIRKGERADAACAVFDLEVIVFVIVWVNVWGDSPSGRFDVERVPPLGSSVFGNTM